MSILKSVMVVMSLIGSGKGVLFAETQEDLSRTPVIDPLIGAAPSEPPSEPPPPAPAIAPLRAPDTSTQPREAVVSSLRGPKPPTTPLLPVQERRFGARGEIVVSGLLSGSLGHLGYSATGASSTSALVEPALDYFLVPNVSLGASVFAQYNHSTSGISTRSTSWGYGAYGRLGGNVALGETFSWRPVGSLGLWTEKTTLTAPGPGYSSSLDGLQVPANGTYTPTVVVIGLFAPLLVHLASHFFVGLGPDVYTDLSHDVGGLSNKRTFVGLSSIVGGWF